MGGWWLNRPCVYPHDVPANRSCRTALVARTLQPQGDIRSSEATPVLGWLKKPATGDTASSTESRGGARMDASDPLLVPPAVMLGGDIDLVNARDIGDDICMAIHRANGEALVVDLSHVPFIDSSAIAMMVRVHGYAESWRKTVVWRRPQEQPANVLHITGVDTVLNLDT
jgi:anti-anti-sigma factor